MQDPQDRDGLTFNPVDCDIRRPLDDQLAGSLDPTRTPDLGRVDQKLHLSFDPIVDQDGGARAVGFDMSKIASRSFIANKVHSIRTSQPTILFARRCTASCKVLLDAVVSEGRAWVCERLAHLGAKPLVMSRPTRSDRKG